MENFIKVVLTAAFGVLFVAVVMFLVGAFMAIPVYYIWNYMIPELFGLPVLTWWQAFWGTFLCGLLFKGGNVQQKK